MASEWTPKVGEAVRIVNVSASRHVGLVLRLARERVTGIIHSIVDDEDLGFEAVVVQFPDVPYLQHLSRYELEPAIDTPPFAQRPRLTFDWKGISEENLLQLQTVLEDIMANDDGYAGWVAQMHFSLVADADEKEWRTAQHGE